jgi:circadian clock protein KaiC
MKEVEKLATGIPGFDVVSRGGLPRGRTTLLAGTAGSAKTVFAAQFLAAGIQQFDEGGVFVTFEEPPEDIRRNMRGLSWDIAAWERGGRWAFVDASPQPELERVEAGAYDLGAMVARVEAAVRKVGARRVVLDSLSAVFGQFEDAAAVRQELQKVAVALRKLDVTALVTAERTADYGDIARFGVEEFVADNVILLRNVLGEEKRRRTVEILKFRGADHRKGEHPFTVLSGSGVHVLPLSASEEPHEAGDERLPWGVPALDAMCGGGLFRQTVTLVSGTTGTGKTLLGTAFAAGGAARGERCLVVGFEEAREQLGRAARSWGVDVRALEAKGLLRLECAHPESAPMEDHLLRLKRLVDEMRPQRLVVDSLSALSRVGTPRGFREVVVELTSFARSRGLTTLLTAGTPSLGGEPSPTEEQVFPLTDTIVLLRYVEVYSEMRRGVAVLKMRGSAHDREIRELTIDDAGAHIGAPFRNVGGILTGRTPQYSPREELERMAGLFREG